VPCNDPDYVKGSSAAVADLRAAIAHLSGRPDIDPSRIVSAGQSAGGLTTVALTADPPKGLVAGIRFAGGRGSRADHEICHEERLIEAMRRFGQRSRLPMLWIYTENDRYFGPALARKMRDAFAGAGGQVDFVLMPPFGTDIACFRRASRNELRQSTNFSWASASSCGTTASAAAVARTQHARKPVVVGTRCVREISRRGPAQGIRYFAGRSMGLAIGTQKCKRCEQDCSRSLRQARERLPALSLSTTPRHSATLLDYACRSGTRSTRPSSSCVTLIWQDNREFGRTS
jgi:dienelactone hydrolase